MIQRILACLLHVSLSTTAGLAGPLFTEDFNAEISVKGRHRQAQSGLPVKHGYDAMPGWTRAGAGMPAHFVERSPGDWALMVVAGQANENIFTMKKAFAANDKGHTYIVAFDVAPAVYRGLSQTTAADDQLAVELLRADGTVLAKHLLKPGKWEQKGSFTSRTFTYVGDGAGPLRFRISPVYTSGTRFYGAIDNLQVFKTKAEADIVIRKRAADSKRAREEFAKRLRRREKLPLPAKDWLFQAGGKATAKRAGQEIAHARELAQRIAKAPKKPDLSVELKQLAELERTLNGRVKQAGVLDLYLAVRRVKRAITFKNPAVDFSGILLVDSPYPGPRHESAHRHGYRTRGQGRLLVLEGLSPDSPVRSLVPDKKAGFLWRPDLSFDAGKIVFCLMPRGERSFHLYEVNTDGTGFRQLTFGDYDDLDPIYLPNGKLMFTTTRANTYVRCGPTHHSPVLARCDADGKNIYVISRNNEPDYLPALLPDGRVIFTRWEYTDKEQKRLQSLWTMNPDGTGVYAFWGNQSVWPDILAEPRPIPETGKIMFTGVGHHQWFNGSIGTIDPSKGMNYPHGLSKVTAEVAWPEVGNGPREHAATKNYRPGPYRAYKTPYPISEHDFLVSIRQPRTGRFSLYLMDLTGNRELIYTGKDNVWHAMPLRPRPKPPIIPDQVEWPKIGPDQPPLKDGILYSANVFEGAPLLPKDKIKYLRVLQIDAKTYTPWHKTYQHSGPSISITQADGVKRILGTTPVEADGSVCFKAPPAKALHFQLLDEHYRCVQTMRSFTGVMPAETRGCVGCHEGRSSGPVNTKGGLAMRRGAQALRPPPWGADVSIAYERFVQPVLDKYCGKCHQGEGKARKKLDLTFRPSTMRDPVFRSLPPQFTEPYVTLVGGGNNWYQPVAEELINKHGLPVSISGCLIVEGYRERTAEALATLKPGTHMSAASLLISRAMDEKHIGAKMDAGSLRRLIGWVDANGPYLGDQEIRRMPDPVHKPEFKQPYNAHHAVPMPVVKPRLKTAPRINRFNIRQDGDSSKVYLGAKGADAKVP